MSFYPPPPPPIPCPLAITAPFNGQFELLKATRNGKKTKSKGFICLFIYIFTSFSGHRPAQRECARTGLRSHARCHPYPLPQPVKFGHTTGIYDPYSFWFEVTTGNRTRNLPHRRSRTNHNVIILPIINNEVEAAVGFTLKVWQGLG